MKIEESFVTMSLAEFKYFCKTSALRFQKGFDETEFIMFFEDRKKGLLSQGRMTELKFCAYIERDQE